MDSRWDELVADVAGGEVTTGSMFGAKGLRTGRRYFALYWHDKLVLKLPPERAAELGPVTEQFEPMPGRPMGEWVLVADDADWPALAEEANAYVSVVGRD
ncbi:hypothetical protein GCM10027047_26410 [Rhodococcus aerolatus]